MNTFLEQFGCYLGGDDQIKAEWPMLKNAVLEAFLLSSEKVTWAQIHRRFQDEYPHVLNFFDLILTVVGQ